ncbi:MAG: siderophore-interacting protein [Steroidobacteraceae bacterium]
MQTQSTHLRSVQRVRHETRTRLLTVKRVTRITPRMVRVTLTGDLAGFISSAADDHVKVFFPAPGSAQPVLPKGPPGSPAAAQGPTPIMRDYTPRRYDAAANELDIEFVLHSEGPATTWARQAQVGQTLGIGGPRGSFIVTGDFDWYLLIADEAGLPAVARRLQELPAGAQVFVIVEVEDASEHQPLESRAAVNVSWVHRQGHRAGTPDLLQTALGKLALPGGEGYAWIACESNVARSLRKYLVDERGCDKTWIKAAGYWKQGAVATHEKHED